MLCLIYSYFFTLLMFQGEKQDPKDGAGSQPSVMAPSLAQMGILRGPSLPATTLPGTLWAAQGHPEELSLLWHSALLPLHFWGWFLFVRVWALHWAGAPARLSITQLFLASGCNVEDRRVPAPHQLPFWLTKALQGLPKSAFLFSSSDTTEERATTAH